jgi:hypothetical protein
LLADIALLPLELFEEEALIEALFALSDEASCAPFAEVELLAALFELAEFAAELTFDAELSEALAFRALFDELASLAAVPLLELVPAERLAAREAFPANDPLAEALWLAALLLALFAAALFAAPLSLVAPCPFW